MKLKIILIAAAVIGIVRFAGAADSVASQTNIDYEAFLEQHDMVWDRIPNRWEVAPYTGNGNVGFLFYQAQGEAKNVISIYAGRHDYYDHREPHDGEELLWIYRTFREADPAGQHPPQLSRS